MPNMNEKREKILSVAVEEFAENGYRNASTNRIAARAGVSKGIIFHYFTNKSNLYLVALDSCLEKMKKLFEEHFKSCQEKDVFEKLRLWAYKKVQISMEYPVLSKFLLSVIDLPEDLRDEVMRKIQSLQQDVVANVFRDFEGLKLRKGLSHQDAMKFVLASLNGLGNMYIKMYENDPQRLFKDKERILTEAEKYLQMIKFGILDR